MEIVRFIFVILISAHLTYGQGNSVLCSRFPNNPNCARPAVAAPQSNQGSAATGDTCQSWRSLYYTYCTGTNVQPQYQSSCAQYQQTCLSGSSTNGFSQQRGSPVDPSSVGLPPPPTNGGFGSSSSSSSSSSFPSNSASSSSSSSTSNLKNTWDQLTQQAQEEQVRQAMTNAQNGQADCGQYNEHYNVWCGGIKPINPTYCSMMQSVCLTQAQQAASGKSPIGGPFAANNGLPTAGAGSSRPLTIGQNFGVGPFFGMGKNLGINPLQGVGQRSDFNVPIAGIGVTSSRGVDYGGLLGVSQLGQLLQGGRRRRHTVPLGFDHFGNHVDLVFH